MSLRLIYGRTGTGKTTAIFNEIKENIKSGSKKYIITPEQFSYSAEKNLLDILGTKAVINAEVLTFNRMAKRVAEEVGGKTEINLSKSGKAMLIYSILEKQKGKLKFLGDSENSVDLALQSIKEFKKHGITEEFLNETIEKVDNPLLEAKLLDLQNVYSNYETSINKRFIDEEDVLTKLANRLEESQLFQNTEIYIDEFSGFTKQEFNIIEKLLTQAKRLTVSFSMDNLDAQNQDTDIFYSNKITAKKLIQIAKDNNVAIEKPVELQENYKLKSKELVHLEQNLYKNPYTFYGENVKDISLFLALNPYSEIEQVARDIIKLVRDKGFKYSEIAIITKSINEIASMAKAVLTKNDIPVFIDEKEDLAKSQIVKYVLSILEIFSKNWSQEAVLSYVKSGFLDIKKEDIYKLENYVIKWGVRSNKWYKADWDYEEENPNELRLQIVKPLLELKQSLDGKKTAVNISKVLYKFLKDNNIFEKVQFKIDKYEAQGEIIVAKNYKSSFDILMDVMDEIVKIYENEKMTFARYQELLKIGLAYKELGNIPEAIDQVILGDVDRTRSHKIRAVFIIGLNDGAFPTISKSEGFINDQERDLLKNLGAELAKGTLDLLYEDQFNTYKALTTAEEKLYLLYTSTNKSGETLRPSILITKIKKIFPKLQEESDVVSEIAEITSKEATFIELLKKIQNRRKARQKMASGI